MKIGIISINAHTKVLNFASPLHSYAFQQFLTQHGYESVIIDYKPSYYGRFNARHPYDYYVKHPVKNRKKQELNLKRWKELYKEREIRFDKFKRFIKKYYVTTDVCYNHKMLDTEDVGCDIYICATDVIWKNIPNKGFERGFFLDCDTMKGKGKIAYAASRGTNPYIGAGVVKEFKRLVEEFDYVSCREKSLYEYVNKKTKVPAGIVLDPVFLHDEDFYKPLYKNPDKRGYVLIYVVMEDATDTIEQAVHFAKERNLEVIELSEVMENRFIPEGTEHEVIYDIGIEEWLGYMKNADYIFTNSFHCCCFSIIMHKNFYAGKRGGDKLDWLLELFKLEGRRMTGRKLPADEPIDYATVDELRKKYKAQSEQFILGAIEKTQKRLEENADGPKNGLFKRKKELYGLEDIL